MAKTATSVKPYDPVDETWDMFMARFDCFLRANDDRGLPDDQKRDLFMHHCGKAVFRTAIALMALTPVHTVAWQTLQDALWAHYAPAPSKYAQRFEFRQQVQREEESINEFVATLREAALLGDYGGFLDDPLLEQFLCGVRDVALRQQLLQKTGLLMEMLLGRFFTLNI